MRLAPSLLLAIAAITLWPITLSAQAPLPDAQTTLRAQLIGKRFLLRNFSSATEVHGTWNGQALSLEDSPWHMFAALTVNKVRVYTNQVTIQGDRSVILRDTIGFIRSSIATPITITLTGDSASLAAALPGVLFYPNLEAAFLALPKAFHGSMPPLAKGPKGSDPKGSQCDCAAAVACAAVLSKGITVPKVVKSVDPEWPDDAHGQKISGRVQIAVLLSPTGAITDVWIARDMGLGFDQPTAIAASKFRFLPANCHGVPISTSMLMDFDFQTP